MKEFLEKRWWQGVGGIAGITALVLVVLQLLGKVNISGLVTSIVLNIVFAIAIALTATWAIRWRRRYGKMRDALKEIKKSLEKEFLEQQKQLEKRKEAGRKQRVLLPDPNYIWRLNIDNALLTELYGEAHGQAVAKYHDAKLASIAMIANPYREEDRIAILFGFFSRWADRQCTYIVSEIGNMQESLPDRPAKDEADRAILDELPWLRDPNWPEFLRKSCEKAGPLSTDRLSSYQLAARTGLPTWLALPWSITFQDGVTGGEFRFEWDGKGEPIPEEAIQKALRKKIRSWLKRQS